MYHKLLLPSPLARVKSDVKPSSLDDAVMATREAFGDQRLDPSPGGIVESILTVTGDDGGAWVS